LNNAVNPDGGTFCASSFEGSVANMAIDRAMHRERAEMRSQWILIEFSHRRWREVDFGSGWNALMPSLACVDKGVKRQHEYTLQAAVADGGGGLGVDRQAAGT